MAAGGQCAQTAMQIDQRLRNELLFRQRTSLQKGTRFFQDAIRVACERIVPKTHCATRMPSFRIVNLLRSSVSIHRAPPIKPKDQTINHMNAPNELPKHRGLLRLATICLFFLLTAAAAMFVALPAPAQEITGTPGSPSATTTISGEQLPAPPEKSGGVIKERALDSTPYWPPRIVPPKGAPNILLIMTDDQGYGVSGSFGGVIPTPALDRVAKAGLRYTQFHSTALCSPTR